MSEGEVGLFIYCVEIYTGFFSMLVPCLSSNWVFVPCHQIRFVVDEHNWVNVSGAWQIGLISC